MPVGQWLELQRSAWMQPSANIIARAALQMSAPSATLVAIWNPVFTLPDATRRTWSRSPTPTSALCTNDSPSFSGVPMESENSSGAAPVPPSAPSTVMKSGTMPDSSMALTMPRNS